MRPYVNPFDVNNFGIIMKVRGNPAAGALISDPGPANARSTLALVSFKLVTNANVADRSILIRLTHAANVYLLGATSFVHAASTTMDYLGGIGMSHPFLATFSSFCFSLIDCPLISGTETTEITVDNIQVGDQLSDIRFIYKVWPY